MTRSLRGTACAVAALPLLALGGCSLAPVVLAVGGTLAAAGEAYCAATTEEAKQAIRLRVTGGRQLIHCDLEDE